MIIPHYWNPLQVERLLDSLVALGLRRARVAALITWRSGLRVGETVALELRDIGLTALHPTGSPWQGWQGPDRSASPGSGRHVR